MFEIKKSFNPAFNFSRDTSDLPPQYNEPYLIPRGAIVTHPKVYADMDYWLERSAEVLGLMNALTNDLVSDGFVFEGDKRKVQRAYDFANKNMFKSELKNSVS